MRLTKVTITNYRCITDSGPVEIGDVTCLVGKNESGKTAFLQALRRLNPVEGSTTYSDVLDYPAKSFARYKRVRDKQPAKVVTAVFELSDDEVATIEGKFGSGVLRQRTFTVTKHYPPGRPSSTRRSTRPLRCATSPRISSFPRAEPRRSDRSRPSPSSSRRSTSLRTRIRP
jgi:AAA ATPase domain